MNSVFAYSRSRKVAPDVRRYSDELCPAQQPRVELFLNRPYGWPVAEFDGVVLVHHVRSPRRARGYRSRKLTTHRNVRIQDVIAMKDARGLRNGPGPSQRRQVNGMERAQRWKPSKRWSVLSGDHGDLMSAGRQA
jgi:hypothetical protein